MLCDMNRIRFIVAFIAVLAVGCPRPWTPHGEHGDERHDEANAIHVAEHNRRALDSSKNLVALSR